MWRKVALSLVLLGALACGEDLLLPGEAGPRALTPIAGDGQQGTVASTLPDSVTIAVTDRDGRPVVGVPVAFSSEVPGSRFFPDTALTDASGRAAAEWLLGTVAGRQEGTAALIFGSSTALQAKLRADAVPAAAATIEALQGDNQSALPGEDLADSLVARVTDQFGNPVSGYTVQWSTGDDGTVSPASSVTDGGGRAAVSRTLGSFAGNTTTTASAPGLTGSPLTFSATVLPPPTPRLSIITQPGPTEYLGRQFASEPEVQLEDANGQPLRVNGVSVSVAIQSGGGFLVGTTVQRTNSSGIAKFKDLVVYGSAGQRTLIFMASGFTPAVSQPFSVVLRAPSGSQSALRVSNVQAQVGQPVTVTIQARDASGTPLAGVQASLSANAGQVTQPASVTDVQGEATGSVVLSQSGSVTVSAQVGGVPVQQQATVTFSGSGGSAQPDPAQTQATVPRGKVGRATTITIKPKDSSGQSLTTGGFASRFSVSVSGANSASPAVTDLGNGNYQASYVPQKKGTDSVAISFDGTPIKGSPYQSKVK